MRIPVALAAALAALAMAALATATPAGAQPGSAPSPIAVTLERQQDSVGVGDRLTIRARIVNAGTQPTDPLIAHLNVATLDSSVYVDLEDWTATPTQDLAPLASGGTASASWEIQAVNVGRFDVYVVLLPNGPASSGRGPLVASPPELVQVSGRQTLSPGGALQVVIAEPLVLGLVLLGARWRLRRRR